MSIDPTTNAATAGAASQIDNSRTRLADNYQTFLSLLTAQLKNQDPLSPMDSNQFTQQIVQMTGVEQQLMTNDLLTKLVANSTNDLSQAVGMIGKQVTAESADTTLKNGAASWTYSLDAPAATLEISVLDADGRVVHTESATEAQAGAHTFDWNGKDLSGADLPDGGTYTLAIKAKNATGSTIGSHVTVSGRIGAVETVDGQTVLSIGNSKAPWSAITFVGEQQDQPDA